MNANIHHNILPAVVFTRSLLCCNSVAWMTGRSSRLSKICAQMFSSGGRKRLSQCINYVYSHSITRLHCSTVYIDAAYCYRPSIMICRSVCHSHEPCKMAETIEIPFGLWARMGLRNRILDWVQIAPYKFWQFLGERTCSSCPTTLWHELCKNGWMDRDTVWLWTRMGPRKHMLHGGVRWCNLKYTESFVCGGDAALWQITLTTCYLCYLSNICTVSCNGRWQYLVIASLFLQRSTERNQKVRTEIVWMH